VELKQRSKRQDPLTVSEKNENNICNLLAEEQQLGKLLCVGIEFKILEAKQLSRYDLAG